MKLSKFSIITIGLTIAIAIGLIYFAILPTITNISTAKTDKIAFQDEEQSTSKQLTFLEKIHSNETEINQYSLTAENLIPPEPNIQSLILDIEAFMKTLPLKNSTFEIADLISTTDTPQPGAKKPSSTSNTLLASLTTHQFTISGNTKYSNIFSIISKIQNLSRLAEITTINLSSGGSTAAPSSTSSSTSVSTNSKNELSVQIIGNFFSKSSSNPSGNIKTFDSTILGKAALYLHTRVIYGPPIKIEDESGFGRSNPFQAY